MFAYENLPHSGRGSYGRGRAEAGVGAGAKGSPCVITFLEGHLLKLLSRIYVALLGSLSVRLNQRNINGLNTKRSRGS